jgi:hypothetical protein
MHVMLLSQGCVDLWLDMAYSWCTDYESHSSTRNRSPTPLSFIDEIIQTYVQHNTITQDWGWFGLTAAA